MPLHQGQVLRTTASFTTPLPITSHSITGLRYLGRAPESASSPTAAVPALSPVTWRSTMVLRNNGIPGVAIHTHAPGDTFADNVIAGNQISGNGADTGDTATPGTTGININSGFGGSLISGTVISQNVISQEGYDLFINTPAQVDAHLNSFVGHNAVGVDNSSGNAVNVTENWWGCFGGPGVDGCSSIEGSALFNPWLVFPFGLGGPF